MQKPQLVSFKLCPFVFRAMAVKFYKKLDIDVVYIDLNNKPGWFKEMSPLGKVPILKIQDTVLFDSYVIMEYLDEMSEPFLQPTDLNVKIVNRSYYGLANEFLGAIRRLYSAKDPNNFGVARQDINYYLGKLEEKLQHKYFNGDQVNLIDLCLSSVFVQLNTIQQFVNFKILENFPKVKQYSQEILALEAVQQAKVPEFDEMFFLRGQASHAYFIQLQKRPTLISFALCPFTMRIRILLELKEVAYDAKWIDIRNKPDWLKEVSPQGKVPVLLTEGKSIWDSVIISEYLEETTNVKLLPPHPLDKAECKAWTYVANELQSAFHPLFTEKDVTKIDQIIANGEKKINLVEQKLNENYLFFFGNKVITLTDVAFGPVFNQLGLFQQILQRDFYEKFPKVKRYVTNLFMQPAFVRAVPSNYVEMSVEEMKKYFDSAILKIGEQQKGQ